MLEEESYKTGKEMYKLMEKIFPICSSITGNGPRKILNIIKEQIPLEIHEVPSGTRVFDWTVPKEWNIKDAYVKDGSGDKIIDLKKSNLHVLNYSVPINKKVNLPELKEHLFTMPEHPNWIPYRTSYYKESWGFCIPHSELKKLEEGEFEVFIDSSLEDGSLTYGELYIPGKVKEEVLFTCYHCHPSQCNDNSSGVALLTFMAKQLLNTQNNYSYRFLFIPETIGSITWLNRNEDKIDKIKGGFVCVCVGDNGPFTFKRTRKGDTEIDHATEVVLKESKRKYSIIDFDPSCGSDERQFCSPGINLNVGSLMRTPYTDYPQYHTSADNLDCVTPEALGDSFEMYMKIQQVLEQNKTYKSLNPKCEPQFGKRGLYRLIGGQQDGMSVDELGIYWIMSYSDGNHSLLDISRLSGLEFEKIMISANALVEADLLEEV